MHVERKESAVFGDDRQVGLGGKVPHGGFHAHDVPGPVGLSGDDVHRTDVDVGYGRGEKDMHGLRKPRFDAQGPNLRRRFRRRLRRNLRRRHQGGDKCQINEVSFHSCLLFF